MYRAETKGEAKDALTKLREPLGSNLSPHRSLLED